MLTVEYRVNGQLIGVTNIVNIGKPVLKGFDFGEGISEVVCSYQIEHFSTNQKTILRTKLRHKRSDGFEELVRKTLMKLRNERSNDDNCNN